MTFATGSLVRARGREWVVLPASTDDLLLLRPLGGTDAEVTGIYVPLEPVVPATFARPDPDRIGDARSGRLLREAVRLGLRAGAGPFRSFGRLGFEPRPYQLVPLLMALRLDPIRLLIADDVGIGKTIEAGLIARELLDRGEIERLAVICPPQLAEQWQQELADKFQIQAELVLPSTAAKLEKPLGPGESIFDVHKFTIVSLDFIKSARRRGDFMRAGPELIIVDEAHNSASDPDARGRRHQRYELLRGLAAKAERHLILVSATPHSGNEATFRSLLTLLRPDFAELPDDLGGEANRKQREAVARHLVQRRRADIVDYLGEDTPFPKAIPSEETYKLSSAYQKLLQRAIEYARQTTQDNSGSEFSQRVRWWSALALLRSLSSSPAAAIATLKNRALGLSGDGADGATDEADTATEDEGLDVSGLNELGRQHVLDSAVDEASEDVDVGAGADLAPPPNDPRRRQLKELRNQAEELLKLGDTKLEEALRQLKTHVKAGRRPIVFCRFIATAEYVGEKLKETLGKNVRVEIVTGSLPPSEREARVAAMKDSEKRVLVCTDCLSEGINLQELFDTVFHYDLLWNPTRHAQREGRVDRYGQPRAEVRTVLFYGEDNPVDGMVMDVLLRKHNLIRTSLGVSVPVPLDSDRVIGAILEGLLMRRQATVSQDMLPGFDEITKPQRERFHDTWDQAVDREKRSRTIYAQAGIKPEEVRAELDAARTAVGSSRDLAWFVATAVQGLGGVAAPPKTPAHAGLAETADRGLAFDLTETPRAFRDLLGGLSLTGAGRFTPPVSAGEWLIHRAHPLVEALAGFVADTALDPKADSPVARRSGAMRTAAVTRRTTLLLLRARYHLLARRRAERELLAEEALMLAYTGAADNPTWLEPADVEALLAAEPAANITAEQARDFVAEGLAAVSALEPEVEARLHAQAEALRQAHQRVRLAASGTGGFTSVTAQLPFDLVGLYVYLPAPR
jgi:superfamily II DNA or RNA helicase